jgi:hypothetical protein
MIKRKNHNHIRFDARLSIPLDYVCKLLDVTIEDFTSLAIANLLEEELDWIEHDRFHEYSKELKTHKITVNIVKFEANKWVINRK